MVAVFGGYGERRDWGAREASSIARGINLARETMVLEVREGGDHTGPVINQTKPAVWRGLVIQKPFGMDLASRISRFRSDSKFSVERNGRAFLDNRSDQ